jgi:hypothetical protein
MNKPTQKQIKEVLEYLEEQKKDSSKKEVEKTKIKKYRWKRFCAEFKSFFYDKQEHGIRKGPWLMVFMINVMAITCSFGWLIVSQMAAGKVVNIMHFVAFATGACTMFVNFYSIIKYKKAANEQQPIIPTSLTSAIPNMIGPLTGSSPSTPAPPANGTPLNTKILSGDNR